MGRLLFLLIGPLIGLAGCADASTPLTLPGGTATNIPSATQPVASPLATPRPLCDTAIVGEPDPAKIVDARANIYASGRSQPVDPGGLGAGAMPPVWQLPEGDVRTVSLTDVAGCVTPITGTSPFNGPAGDGYGPTLIEPYLGISGITHQNNGMFLVGVFLTDAEPTDPPSPTLDFTGADDFDVLEPELGQVFYIGDGEGRRVIAPRAATRLFLGFADAPAYRGAPGAYDNNAGWLQATVVISVE